MPPPPRSPDPRAAAAAQSAKSAASASSAPSPPPRELSFRGDRRIRVELLELIGTQRAEVSDHIVEQRRQAFDEFRRAQYEATREELTKELQKAQEADQAAAEAAAAQTKQPVALASSAATTAAQSALSAHAALLLPDGTLLRPTPDADSAEPDEDAIEDALHAPLLSNAPWSESWTRRHVIERQLAPLLTATRMSEVPVAIEEVQSNLRSLNLHFQHDRGFQIDLLPLSDRKDALIPLSEGGTHLPGNDITVLGTRKSDRMAFAHPTLLERLAAETVRRIKSVAHAITGADDDDDDDSPPMLRGGIGLPSAAPLPLKLTVACPPEKVRPFLKLEVKTASSSNLRGERQLEFGFPNLTGRGDRLSFKLQQGLSSQLWDLQDTSLQTSISVPDLLTSGGSVNELTVHVDKHELPDSSMQQSTRGAQFRWATRDGRHSIVYALQQRELRPVSTRLPDEFVSVDGHAHTINAAPAVAAAAASPAAAGLPSAASAPAAPAPRLHATAYLPSWLQSTPAATVPVARWREPSPSVMHMLGSGLGHAHSLKSSLKYSFAHVSRSVDSASAPTQGWTVGASAELAGVGGVGDAKFIRLETEGKKFWSLLRGAPNAPQLDPSQSALSLAGLSSTLRSMHLSLGVGGLAQYVHNLSSSPTRASRVFFSDRLFFGHPLSLRGFDTNVSGPHDGADALGGELCLASSVHLGFRLPGYASHGLRGHVFWNAGNLIGILNGGPKAVAAAKPAARGKARNNAAAAAPAVPALAGSVLHSAPLSRSSLTFDRVASKWLSDVRSSVGFGIVAPIQALGAARLEFNFAHPISFEKQDKMEHKWPVQFGLGIQWI